MRLLDEDVGEAMWQAGVIVLRWVALLAGAILLVRALVGCGGLEFQGLGPIPGEAGNALDGRYALQSTTPDAGPAEEGDPWRADAGAAWANAGILDATHDPPPDAIVDPAPKPDGSEPLPPPPVDAGMPPPPPLCCLTPCSGSSAAAITCGNGADWTCAAGSCAQRACSVGAACMWMGVCSGRVEVCP